MSQLKQTDDGDIAIENNKFVLVVGRDEIRQRVIQNLKTFLGEWFLDITLGVPYYQLIFVKDVAGEIKNALLQDEILSTVGITGLTKFDGIDLDPETREGSVDFEARTSAGDISLIVEVP